MIHSLHILPILSFFAAVSLFGNSLEINKQQSELSATMHASPSHDFTSVAQDYDCTIEIAPDTLTISKAICRFKFSDLDSGKSSRDKKMCNWMGIDQYPEASFEMTHIEPDPETGLQIAVGNFTMHGVSKEMRIPFTVTRIGGQIQVEGQTEIDHLDWGLKQVRLLFFSVDTKLKAYFRIKGKLSQDA